MTVFDEKLDDLLAVLRVLAGIMQEATQALEKKGKSFTCFTALGRIQGIVEAADFGPMPRFFKPQAHLSLSAGGRPGGYLTSDCQAVA